MKLIEIMYCQCGGASFKPEIPKDYDGKVCKCKEPKAKVAKFESH
jgi:hypothetical protein